jgi:hypothetical protein
MKKKAAKRKVAPLLPPITVSFEEAVSRLLRVKPEPRKRQRLGASKRKRISH